MRAGREWRHLDAQSLRVGEGQGQGEGANKGEMAQHVRLCVSCRPFRMPGWTRKRGRERMGAQMRRDSARLAVPSMRSELGGRGRGGETARRMQTCALCCPFAHIVLSVPHTRSWRVGDRQGQGGDRVRARVRVRA